MGIRTKDLSKIGYTNNVARSKAEVKRSTFSQILFKKDSSGLQSSALYINLGIIPYF